MKSLITNRLILKTLDESFADQVLNFIVRNKEFHKVWEAQKSAGYFTLNYQKSQLRIELAKIHSGEIFKLWLFKKDDPNSKIIGSVVYSNIIRGCSQSCHLGYKIDKDEANKGYITEAVEVANSYVFHVLELHRIQANIMPSNYASLRVVEKLGFSNEGLAKNYLKINGKWEDHIHMVLLNKAME